MGQLFALPHSVCEAQGQRSQGVALGSDPGAAETAGLLLAWVCRAVLGLAGASAVLTGCAAFGSNTGIPLLPLYFCLLKEECSLNEKVQT